jgi:hypothetical protein
VHFSPLFINQVCCLAALAVKQIGGAPKNFEFGSRSLLYWNLQTFMTPRCIAKLRPNITRPNLFAGD